MQSTLVLSASFEPLEIVSARRAVSLILKGKATSVDDSNDFYASEKDRIPVPFVILLKRNIVIKDRYGRKLQFSRRGVLVRDNFLCAYCGGPASTIDHVLPSSKGGATSYENCVAACTTCNNKKSDTLLEHMGWTLSFIPAPPSAHSMLVYKAGKSKELHQIWEPWISPWTKSQGKVRV